MSKIEPLGTLLKIYKDKNRCLLQYLPDETIKKMLFFKGDIFKDYNEENFVKILHFFWYFTFIPIKHHWKVIREHKNF